MTDLPPYEVVVVGGGPAGMTTAIYTTRLGHRTAVFEREGGRHAAVSHVHNLYGVSEDVSGSELAGHAVDQFQEYGGDYYLETVESIHRNDDEFLVESAHATVRTEAVVFATGFTDIEPSVPDLEQFTGRGLHYCLHCDAFVLGDSPVFVLGHDDHAAQVAMLMLNFTADVDLLLDGRDPDWDEETEDQLQAHPVERIDATVTGAFPRDEEDEQAWLGGLTFEHETESRRPYRGGFALYGREYNTALPESLGCALTDDGAVDVDEDHRTSVDDVYAVGDLTHGQNQTAIALGDGARAGVAIHKDLRTFPRAPETDDDSAFSEVPAAPPDLRARMRLLREREYHAGLRDPHPRR